MSIASALAASESLVNGIDAFGEGGVPFPTTDRARLAAALLDQVHEHHSAIRQLVRSGAVGSAFALVRVAFETMVRGIWIFRCASDAEIQAFQSDRLEKPLSRLIAEVEDAVGVPGTALSSAKNRYWAGMCSYAHGGYLQAMRRITADDIGPNYSEEEQVFALSFADFCVTLASIEMFSLADRTQDAKRIVALFSSRL
jgi:hypothetical protein